MTVLKCQTFIMLLTVSISGFSQPALLEVAEPGNDLDRVWHLGRVTGDLERIVHFYHDILGLGFRGDRSAPIPFYSVDTINEFVDAPPQAEFRAAFMPIPGTSNASDPLEQIYLEAFEYRNISRQQIIPALSDIGVSSIKFLLHDLDKMIESLERAGVAFVSTNHQAVPQTMPAGFQGSARAVMVRDPDGYPVELMEITPSPKPDDGISESIYGAHMTLIVKDLGQALDFYRQFVGTDLQVWENGGWQNDEGFNLLRGLSDVESKSAGMLLPGSSIVLELIELRNVEQQEYRPIFQDIGFGHIAFMANNIERITERMAVLAIEPLSQSGTWTQISPTLRAVYTRDYNGFFLEIIE